MPGQKTIYNLFKNKDIDSESDMKPFYDARIMARIYQSTDLEQINSIICGTNNQNKITIYDLKSLNPNLKAIKTYFEDNNISLMIQRDSEEQKKPKAISSEFLLQIYCSIYFKEPHKSKISKTKLIKERYDEVFGDNENYTNLLNSFKIYDYVKEQNKNNIQKYEYINHAMYSMLYTMTALKPSLLDSVEDSLIKGAYDETLLALDNIVKKQKSEDDNFSSHNFFKSKKSTDAINSFLNEEPPKTQTSPSAPAKDVG